MATSLDSINPLRFSPRGSVLLLTILGPGCQFAFGTYAAGSDAGVTSGGNSATGGSTSIAGGAGTGGSTDYGPCDVERSFKCSELNLLQCSGGRWKQFKICKKAGYCQPKDGVCFECVTDDPPQCSADKKTILTCADPTVGFTPSTTCPADQICTPGNPSCVLCELGQTHCELDGGVVLNKAQRCDDPANGWTELDCTYSCEVRDGINDVCHICVGGAKVCATMEVGGALRNVLRTCVSDGSSWTTTVCPTGCVNGAPGVPASCGG